MRTNLDSLNMHELIKAAPYYRVINRKPKQDRYSSRELHNNSTNEVHGAFL